MEYKYSLKSTVYSGNNLGQDRSVSPFVDMFFQMYNYAEFLYSLIKMMFFSEQ
jgi:hypothetical protein